MLDVAQTLQLAFSGSRFGEILYGRGFEANQDFTNITMKAVEGRVVVEDDQNPNQAENN